MNTDNVKTHHAVRKYNNFLISGSLYLRLNCLASVQKFETLNNDHIGLDFISYPNSSNLDFILDASNGNRN